MSLGILIVYFYLQTTCDQTVLFDANIINGLLPWLNKKQSGILVPVLECLSALVHGNEVIANEVIDGMLMFVIVFIFFSILLFQIFHI